MVITFDEDSRTWAGVPKRQENPLRPATLDLGSSAREQDKFSAILTSPDLNMLTMTTPEMDSFIIANGRSLALAMSQPNATTPQQLFPRSVTDDRENYARGFEDASSEIQHRESIANPYPGGFVPIYLTASTGMTIVSQSSRSQKSAILTNFNPPSMVRPPSVDENTNSSYCSKVLRPPSVESTNSSCSTSSSLPPVPMEFEMVKEKPQTFPRHTQQMTNLPGPSTTLITEEGEKTKLERKRLRNRIAANKCRQRKMEKIAHLEEVVRKLSGENAQLREENKKLKDTISYHESVGCKMH